MHELITERDAQGPMDRNPRRASIDDSLTEVPDGRRAVIGLPGRAIDLTAPASLGMLNETQPDLYGQTSAVITRSTRGRQQHVERFGEPDQQNADYSL